MHHLRDDNQDVHHLRDDNQVVRQFLRRGATALVAALLTTTTSCATTAGPTAPPPVLGSRGAWTRLPEGPLSARHEAVSAWVGDRFLVVGGWASPACPPGAGCVWPADPPLRDGATVDPTSGSWQPIAEAPEPVTWGPGAAVVDGDLYVPTSDDGPYGVPRALLRYRPATDEWTRLPAPPTRDQYQLVAAGQHLLAVDTSSEPARRPLLRLDRATARWHRLPEDPFGDRGSNHAVAWLGDRLLLAAEVRPTGSRRDRPALVQLATLDGRFRRWSEPIGTEVLNGYPMPAGGLVVFPITGTEDGGQTDGWGRSYPHGGIWDPGTNTWAGLPRPPAHRGLPGHLLTVAGRVAVDGHLLDPVSRRYTPVPTPPGGPRQSEAVAAGPDSVLLWGGRSLDRGENLADGYLLRL